MIGLSVSFCVIDIAEGKVDIREVEKIIAGTKAGTLKEIRELVESYKQVYWAKDPARCVTIFSQLRYMGKIHQPRLIGKPAPNISAGHWVNHESEIVYSD